MKTLRIELGILSLIFFPFIALLIINLIWSPYTFESPNVAKEISWGFLFLASLFFLFLLALKMLPERLVPPFVAVFIFSFTLFMLGLVYVGAYQAPDLLGTLANFSVIPSLFLLSALLAISVFTVILMFLMKINKKALALILCFAIGISSGFVLVKELHFRYTLENFFGNYREGGIVFASTYSINKESSVFCLADRKFKRFPNGDFAQTTEILSHGSNFMAYEDSYDRDDLLKIFVVNKKNRGTILLAAGENPVWIK